MRLTISTWFKGNDSGIMHIVVEDEIEEKSSNTRRGKNSIFLQNYG